MCLFEIDKLKEEMAINQDRMYESTPQDLSDLYIMTNAFLKYVNNINLGAESSLKIESQHLKDSLIQNGSKIFDMLFKGSEGI